MTDETDQVIEQHALTVARAQGGLPGYVQRLMDSCTDLRREVTDERERAERNHREAMRAIGALEAVRRERDEARTEVERLQREVEFEARGGHVVCGVGWRDNIKFPLCSCVTDEKAEALVAAGFTRPVCAVHPETRAE